MSLSPSQLEDLLAEVLDRALEARQLGTSFDAGELRSAHPTHAHEIDEVLALADESAVRPGAALPVIEGYELLGELGRGGMGVVYLARQARLAGRLVALKVLPQASALSRRARERFLAETRTLAALRHPGIVPIHDAVLEGEVLAYAMEFAGGRTLAELLEALADGRVGGRPRDVLRHLGGDPARAPREPLWRWHVRLALRVARALEAVHEAGLLHRDVKPSNVLLREDGEPWLADFGLVRDEDQDLMTRTGAFLGTPAYASPEQLRGEELSARSDVYSLGATLYHALALRAPFQGVNALDVLRKVEEGRCSPLRRVDRELPRDLETVVSTAMELEAERRYASASDLAEDLTRLLEERPIRARPAGPWARARKFARRNRKGVAGALGGGALALLTAAALVVWIFLWPGWARDARDAARLALFKPEHKDRVRAAVLAEGVSVWHPESDAHYDEALALYDEALWFAPMDRALAREAAVVRLTDARLAAEGPAFEVPGDILSEVPLVVNLLEGRVSLSYVQDPETAREHDTEELRLAGLHGYLIGSSSLCHWAWGALERRAAADPLVWAAMGQLHLYSGAPERAYPRLLRAALAFQRADTLSIDLADAALRCGDLDVAARWLARVDPALRDPYREGERVRAALLRARGRVEEALALYAEAGRAPLATEVLFEEAGVLAELGRLAEAREVLAELVGRKAGARRYVERYLEVNQRAGRGEAPLGELLAGESGYWATEARARADLFAAGGVRPPGRGLLARRPALALGYALEASEAPAAGRAALAGGLWLLDVAALGGLSERAPGVEAWTRRSLGPALERALTRLARGGGHNLLRNGSFERPRRTGWAGSVAAGEDLGGWTVEGGGVDHAREAWLAAEGRQSVSLNWIGPSTLRQRIVTEPGARYELSLALGGELYGGPEVRRIAVRWNGALLGEPTYRFRGQAPDAMGWRRESWVAVGSGEDELVIESLVEGDYGPALDDVRLERLAE